MKFIKKIKEGESYYNSIIGWKFYKWDKNKIFFAISLRIGRGMIKFQFDDWEISFLVFRDKPSENSFPKYNNKIITIF